MKCLACGQHELRYAICDRWDCPKLLLRYKIEGPGSLSYPQAVTAILARPLSLTQQFQLDTTGGYQTSVVGDGGWVFPTDLWMARSVGSSVELGDGLSPPSQPPQEWAGPEAAPPIQTNACSQCGKYPCECDDC